MVAARVCLLSDAQIGFLLTMIRILLILTLVAAALPRWGDGLVRDQDLCAGFGCHQPVSQAGCCGSDSGDQGFCPASDGPCTCAAAPSPDPEPKREAPMPRSERDFIAGFSNAAVQSIPAIDSDELPPVVAPLVAGLAAGKSHNEIQALLGIWRT